MAILYIMLPEMERKQSACIDPYNYAHFLRFQGQGGIAMKAIGIDGYFSKLIKQSDLHNALISVRGFPAEPMQILQNKKLATRHTLTKHEKKKLRFIVADDNMINQKVAIRLLSEFGYHSDTTGNGKKCSVPWKRNPMILSSWMPRCQKWMGMKPPGEYGPNSDKKNMPIVAMPANAMKSVQ